MPFYRGKTPDGSDMEEVEGMYVSLCGRYWSNMPFGTPENPHPLPETRVERRERERNEKKRIRNNCRNC